MWGEIHARISLHRRRRWNLFPEPRLTVCDCVAPSAALYALARPDPRLLLLMLRLSLNVSVLVSRCL